MYQFCKSNYTKKVSQSEPTFFSIYEYILLYKYPYNEKQNRQLVFEAECRTLMGFSFLKKQQHCSSENERASGRRRVVLHHHSTELLLYLQMVASSSLQRPPRTDEDCKKCNHRGAPAAGATGVEEGGYWNPHFQKAKRRL